MSPKPFADNASLIHKEMDQAWEGHILPVLKEYIKIPNKSVAFDQDWEKNGYMEQAMTLIVNWCRERPIKGMQLEVMRSESRTPLLFIEIPGQLPETILLYGHMDKQPEMVGWDDDLGPWKPVVKGDKLYGRGGADDGYSTFAALEAIAAVQRHGIPHARCVVIIEATEESGSLHLPFYLESLKDRIGNPNFVICLDSGCGNYDQLWCTTSLRGGIGGTLNIDVLKNGMHSGAASGVVPSPFIILRQLLDRIENSETGEIRVSDFKVTIPEQYVQQAAYTATLLKKEFYDDLPFLPGVKMVQDDNVAELLLNRTWRPQLSVIGLDGLPSTRDAGNVTIPRVSVKLSLRIPPTLEAKQAKSVLKRVLEENPPFNAHVSFDVDKSMSGWMSPPLSDWLKQANEQASQQFFAKPSAYWGEGGSIPFMGMLGKMYPEAQFMITGLLGPGSNAHGPNEFMHIPTAKKLTACVASVIASHYEAFRS